MLNYNNSVDLSLMLDFSKLWTPEEKACSFTCVIKTALCQTIYKGSLISIIGNAIHGAQNKEEGWRETVCLKCTDSSSASFHIDNLNFSQKPSICETSFSLSNK